MDPALKALIVALRSIRDQADSVLKKVEQPRGERSLAWKCSACGHVKHFTRPAMVEVAAPCRNVAERPLIPFDAPALGPKMLVRYFCMVTRSAWYFAHSG